ncbi:M2 family metallopeptidase [Candidatus Aminicenantes bacterium AC-335-A11]|jgi:peptidyl-dipeptidase A|nr:M2 family metallopeptidase [SCandidatus Aminicenantes bacterium Aminicenantia_JdfR_composite]MCP2597184.1 M2 family metallopeptidase [Candidatus Aminicenantes bacterium AC-335-G13]MCP2598287.1 M2 family metallopeptidase [Candidatus Aminicenantes bacterium AC-335-L06]MCP2606376.1 M2 family metallopeptidase [Candidatus Aminicenantes bacterium AC-708-I09]MCP2618939.1 M2 family metallopeptidase [Candidatus Aminicenantes bacterium AC-335-A11]
MKNLIGLFIIVFLLAYCSPSTQKVEKDLSQFIKKHQEIVEPLLRDANLAYWNASITGKKEDYDKFEKLQLKLVEIYSNKEDFEKLKKIKESGKVKDPLLKRQLLILYNSYLENQVDKKLLKEIIKLSTTVEKQFNTFRGKIDGKEVTDNYIREILKTEIKDMEKRKKAWLASKQVGKEVANNLIKLVRLRNKAARSLGFDNYYTMALTLNEQSEEELVKIFEELRRLTDEPFRKLKDELDEALSNAYGIKKEDLRPWHYNDPFFQEGPTIGDINLDKYYKGKDIVKLAIKFYEGIGLPVNDIIQRSDLYEKKGKNPHAYTINIDRKGDVRILANIKDTEQWMETILHECGHGVYSKFVDQNLPFFLRRYAHIFTTEAIAMFFGRLSRDPNWMRDMLNIDESEIEKLKPALRRSQKFKQLIFARWSQVMFNFERALYKNPDQDLNKLWWDLVEKYQYIHRPEGRDNPDWAAKIHFTSSPVYYHNYMLGELLASQLHYYIAENILHQDPTEVSYVNNKKIGEYIKERILKPGARYRWNEMIERATGEPLTAKYFVKQFVEN